VNKLDERLLRDLPPFSQLETSQIREILDQATARRFDEGQPVFSEGDPAENFFLLLDGTIRVLRITPEGEQVIALHIAAGELFGIAPALGRTSYPATAMTASDCVALSWPVRLWAPFAETYTGFASATYKKLGERLHDVQARVVEMATQQVEQRIAHTILRLINQTGRKTDIGVEVGFAVTRQDIAEMTGTTLHTVSRLLSAWEKQGLVKSTRKKITVCEPDKLVQLSQLART
jgi:CRP-like cAMP-binding protein